MGYPGTVLNLNVITDKETSIDMQTLVMAQGGFNIPSASKVQANLLINYLAQLVSGSRMGSIDLQLQAKTSTFATGTLTLLSAVATNACVVNGVTFTAVASGATGNQFNVGGTDTITAANLAAAINASVSATIANVVTATSVAAVVTVSAFVMGPIGNSLPLAGGTNITASGAALTGGTYTANVYKYGV